MEKCKLISIILIQSIKIHIAQPHPNPPQCMTKGGVVTEFIILHIRITRKDSFKNILLNAIIYLSELMFLFLFFLKKMWPRVVGRGAFGFTQESLFEWEGVLLRMQFVYLIWKYPYVYRIQFQSMVSEVRLGHNSFDEKLQLLMWAIFGKCVVANHNLEIWCILVNISLLTPPPLPVFDYI